MKSTWKSSLLSDLFDPQRNHDGAIQPWKPGWLSRLSTGPLVLIEPFPFPKMTRAAQSQGTKIHEIMKLFKMKPLWSLMYVYECLYSILLWPKIKWPAPRSWQHTGCGHLGFPLSKPLDALCRGASLKGAWSHGLSSAVMWIPPGGPVPQKNRIRSIRFFRLPP